MFVQADSYGVIITNFNKGRGEAKMKSYRTESSIHLVGKAWQIRIMLKQWMKEAQPHTPLAVLLEGSNTNTNG
jgi:hypothetical protein